IFSTITRRSVIF
ncbi:hypothetical protein VCHENC02_5423B, partial [Vibrio harveyi]